MPLSALTAPNPADAPGPAALPPDRESVAHCPHCGTAVEGGGGEFCCHGCELAAAIIRGAGLERYYRDRSAFPPRPAGDAAADWTTVRVATMANGHCEARLVVDGLRCASCVWVTEQVLERTPGVVGATVSYATGRASIRWDPATTSLPAIARRIGALGYRPRPLEAEPTVDAGLMARMGVAAAATLAIMGLYEGLYAGWWYGSIDPRYAALFRWTSLLLATPVTFWCAEPFFAGAWSGVRHRVLHMDLPIALGIAILYVHGLIATIRGFDGYLDSLAMLVALLLVGRVLESRGRRRATEAASALVGTVPHTARRVRDGRVEQVAIGDLCPGDRIDVGAGEELAADGHVLEGSGQLRMALITGEASPVLVGPGDTVVAGMLLVDGAITVVVQAVGSDTVVHRMAADLLAAQDRAVAPTSADRIAPWFTAVTLAIALATFLGWWLAAGTELAISRTVAVLVVACPCALALSQPLAAAAGLGAAARRGLLLRSADALLGLARIDEAGLDKTGTVTAGALAVTSASDSTLRIAAGLERYSTHPIALAITGEAGRRGIPLPNAAGVRETAGTGIAGMIDGVHWELRAGAAGSVAVRATGSHRQPEEGSIGLGDVIRPDARRAVDALRALGVRATLLTGDHPEIAASIAAEAGVDAVVARADPSAKGAWIRGRQAAGRQVLFAGDGLNDGLALAAADVGIAMATGATSSVLMADGIVGTSSLLPIVAGVRAARAAQRMIRRSHLQSIAYNLLSVGAAAAGLVNPLVAAVLMPLSSAVVIWNAARVETLVRREEECGGF